MIKTGIIAVVGLVLFLSCSPFSASYKADPDLAERKEREKSNTIIGSSSDKRERKRKVISSSVPVIWVGFAQYYEKKLGSDNGIWSLAGGEDDVEEKIVESTGLDVESIIKQGAFDVDIMNCAGYLMSGTIKLQHNSEYFWIFKASSQTPISEAVKKIKQCDVEGGDVISSSAFAVAPIDRKKKGITLGKINTKKLFAEFPKKIQKRIDSKTNLENSERPKSDLDLRFDNWTDLDGDGKVDLVEVQLANEKQSSGLILLLVKGKWKAVSVIPPA